MEKNYTSYEEYYKQEEKNNGNNVTDKFKLAIEEIDKTIKYLQIVKKALIILDKDLPVVDDAAIDIATNLLFNLKLHQN